MILPSEQHKDRITSWVYNIRKLWKILPWWDPTPAKIQAYYNALSIRFTYIGYYFENYRNLLLQIADFLLELLTKSRIMLIFLISKEYNFQPP